MSTTAVCTSAAGATGAVRFTLRAESLAMLAALGFAYHQLHASWALFAALFLVPDLAMLPYLKSRTAGAAAYNAAHNFIGPVMIAAVGAAAGSNLTLAIATIWGAHITFDRAVGYGLKYDSNFNDTHLGRVGRATPPR